MADLGAWAGQELFLNFKPCGICSGTDPHCHCPYMDGDKEGTSPFMAPSKRFPMPKMLVKYVHQSEQGLIVVPQGASDRFLGPGTFMLPGHAAILDTWFCYPQDSMGAFDRMKLRDLSPGVWIDDKWRGQIFHGPLYSDFPGVTRDVTNPVISGPGIISGDLDHPVYSLVCSPSTGILDWNTTIWSDSSPWGRSAYIHSTDWLNQYQHPHTNQCRIYPRLSQCYRNDAVRDLSVDQGIPLTEDQLYDWEKRILRLYFDWKVSNLRWECCEFLRNLIRGSPLPRTSYGFKSDAPTHIKLAAAISSAHGHFLY
jgi:hypothetical protein